MFTGEYTSQIGDKNRIAIPKRLRDQLNDVTIITRGYEKCLIIVDTKRWEYLINEINKKPLLSINVRDTKRYLIGGAQDLEYDIQGRFVLSEALKKFAEIEEKVTFLGVGEWIELWSEKRWQDKLNRLSDNISDLAEKLN